MSEIDFLDLLHKRQYVKGFIPDPENIVFTIEGKTIGSLSNYCTIAGLPKSGKSTYISAILASSLISGSLFGIKLQTPTNRHKIAYFDTESANTEFYAQVQKIKKFAAIPEIPDHLLCFQVREDSPKVIRGMIEFLISQNPDISVIFIDGLLDLCINYNDERETRYLTNYLKRITKQYNILIINVLHLGKKDGETLGHLGSNSDRWAQSTLTITKDKVNKTIILESKFLRSADEINPIVLQNIGGAWYPVDEVKDIDERNEDQIINTLLSTEISYRKMIEGIMRITKKGQNYAKSMAKRWVESGKVTKTGTGYIITSYF